MLGLALLPLILCALVAYLVILPIIRYWTDAKGLRKYPNYSWLSPFTDFNYCYVSAQGFRSRDLYLAHKRTGQPILRIGPNSHSFCDSSSIKDIYGHITPCTKDIKEDVLAGSHRNLFDVVDKPDHALKRKLLDTGSDEVVAQRRDGTLQAFFRANGPSRLNLLLGNQAVPLSRMARWGNS